MATGFWWEVVTELWGCGHGGLGSNQHVTKDTTDVPRIFAFSPLERWRSRYSYLELQDTTTWEIVGSWDRLLIAFSTDEKRTAHLSEVFLIGRLPSKHTMIWLYVPQCKITSRSARYCSRFWKWRIRVNVYFLWISMWTRWYSWHLMAWLSFSPDPSYVIHGITTLSSLIVSTLPLYQWSASWRVNLYILSWWETLCMLFSGVQQCTSLGRTDWLTLWQAHHNVWGVCVCDCPLTYPKWPIPWWQTRLYSSPRRNDTFWRPHWSFAFSLLGPRRL